MAEESIPMLEQIEVSILRALEEDGRLSYAELGEKVGLSKTPCWSRVRDLEQRGIIRGYRADIDAAALGLQLHAFVQVTIDSVKHAEFEAAVQHHPAIIECFTTAGQADYLLHVLVRGIAELDELLRAQLSRLPGAQRLVTTVGMKTIKRGGPVMACLSGDGLRLR
jgi:Lrp/AsnC family transcriptional regulator, leucine-responsive regulatory protein